MTIPVLDTHPLVSAVQNEAKTFNENFTTFIEKNSKVIEEKTSELESPEAFQLIKPEDLQVATDLLSKTKEKWKIAEKLRKEFVEPLNAQVKKINGMFKKEQSVLEDFETLLKKYMSRWHMIETKRVDEIRKKEELARKEREALARKKEQEALDKAAKEEDTQKKKELQVEAEKAAQEADLAETDVSLQADAPTSIRGEGGGAASFKKVWKFEIENLEHIPRKYLIPDEKIIRQAILDGEREIPGVKIFQDTQIAIR